MSIITKMRRQLCTYWGPAANDGFGKLTYDIPISVKCRWDDTQELFIDSNGDQVLSKSIIYPDIVMENGGFVALMDWTALLTAVPSDYDSFEVMSVGQVPNLKNTETLNVVHVR